jgi:acetyl esterase/lipase
MESFSMKNLLLSMPVALCLLIPASAADAVKIDADVVYGHKDGLALTFDVIRPEKSNGAGVLWIQSGGWYSGWSDPKGFLKSGKHFLDRGFTLFIVRHGSSPRYAVPDAIADVKLAARVIRAKARDFSVDPDRLGVIGGSAGGHLSLMLSTSSDEAGRVAAVVALFPPTDLRGWVNDPPEVIRKIPSLKPSLTFDAKKEPDCSPLLKVTAKSAPTLFIHGDKDELVPISHSKNMLAALEKEKVPAKLLVVEGAGHGFNGKQNDELVNPAILHWFETHLGSKKGE